MIFTLIREFDLDFTLGFVVWIVHATMPRRKRGAKTNTPAGYCVTQRHSEQVALRGMIVGLRNEGLTQAEISERVGLSRKTVGKWLRRWVESLLWNCARI